VLAAGTGSSAPGADVPWETARVVVTMFVDDAVRPGADRVTVTPKAREELHRLWERHGPVLLMQGGGCCEGSAPICLPVGDFPLSQTDVLLTTVDVGELPDGSRAEVGFWQSAHLYTYTRHLRMTIDLRPWPGAEFSLESVHDVGFAIDSSLVEDPDPALTQTAVDR